MLNVHNMAHFFEGIYMANKKELWDHNFNALKKFCGEYGRLPKINEIYNGAKIGTWLNSRRNEYRRGLLSPDRIEKLNSINALPDLSIPQLSPKEKIEVLQEYININGYPPRASEKYKGQKIGCLYNNLKINYKKGFMSSEKIEAIKDIIAVFDVNRNDILWMERYYSLKRFIQDNEGRIYFDSDYIEYSDVNLYVWLNNQRNIKNKEKLQLLKEIGYDFTSKKNAKES